ncbi:DUF5682 family protein [Intrasporangium chromatireducens]|uniref:DUF5682 family protein n=1 Tax=Intrasporangium chromatireducens TaxID=1386088 RepID=UPI0004B0CB87|nr:DUF5682 family protein [Intrasporangium chromatireducens]
MTAPSPPRVEVLGIRHHGPGSARSVLGALAELEPEVVVIEGPPELDALVPMAGDPDLVPPVAALVYAVDEPRRSAFYPFAAFSPEWVALQWAVQRRVPVRFADLPATHGLAEAVEDDGSPAPPRPGEQPARPDPLAMLASAAGYDDPERWWEDAVEHRRASSLEQFRHVREALEEVREQLRGDTAYEVALAEDERREAAMRTVMRAVLRAGHQRVAVVCGAFHAPVLDPATFPPASHDTALLKGLPKVKVAATWVPWTAARLAYTSGYGAGVRSPGWYQHLFVTPEESVVSAWFVRVAQALRDERLDASTASVVEATRLAEALAAVRGRPSVGLTELTDAAQAVLAEGSALPLQLIDRTLVIGQELGSVPESTPMVPLAADLARQQKSLRLKVSATEAVLELDLRREAGRARSALFHRLGLIGIDWARPAEVGRTTGTFKEAWVLEWEPELSVAVIEASVHGTTVATAAESSVVEQAEQAADLAALGRLIEQSLRAELPAAVRRIVATLSERTARQHDTLALLTTIEPLARTCRYGNVRGVDVEEVAHVLRTVVVRASVGLRAACTSLDDDAAGAMRAAVEAAHRGIALLDEEDLRTPWHRALAAVAEDDAVHGDVAGRANRLLLDAGELDRTTAGDRLSRHLSRAASGPAAAAWLDGFLTGEALLLLHDDDLLGIIDEWLTGIPEEAFEDVLPLVRRTFAQYQPPERRQLGQHLRRLGRSTPGTPHAGRDATDDVDLDRAGPAIAAVASLLGLGAAS